MNKQELIGHVADRAGLNRGDAARAVGGKAAPRSLSAMTWSLVAKTEGMR